MCINDNWSVIHKVNFGLGFVALSLFFFFFKDGSKVQCETQGMMNR